MSKLAVSKPEHSGTLFYSYLVDGQFAWSSPEDITEFLQDRTKTFVSSVSSLRSFADDITSKDRFIMYYDEPTTLDKIYLSGITQASGLTIDIYADDVSVGSLPTTLVSSNNQTVAVRPRATANELITFPETTNTCFMVEVSGIASSLGKSTNLLVNGDFELGVGSGWSADNFGISIIENSDNNYGLFEVSGGPSSANLVQSFDTTNVTQDINFSLEFSTLDINYSTNGWFLNLSTDDGSLNSSVQGNNYAPGTRYSESFVYPASENNLIFKVGMSTLAGDPFFQLDNITLTSDVDFYSTSPLDYRSLFFGIEVYQPDYNFNYGGALDNSAKYQSSRTQTSNYQFKVNSTRSDQLTVDHESTEAIKDLEYLDYQLVDGYCFYQRDNEATDPSEYFLANFQHGARQNDFRDWNSTSLSFEEAHEWR